MDPINQDDNVYSSLISECRENVKLIRKSITPILKNSINPESKGLATTNQPSRTPLEEELFMLLNQLKDINRDIVI